MTRTLVLVEGRSDRAALLALARRRGLDLTAGATDVVVAGGAAAFGHAWRAHADRAAMVLGLCDAGEVDQVRRGLRVAGARIEGVQLFVCHDDLEDELVRSLGHERVLELFEAQGDLRSFRTFQRQPFQRGRPLDRQLRRFLGTTSGRKVHYGRVLVEALDPTRVPAPLDGILAAA